MKMDPEVREKIKKFAKIISEILNNLSPEEREEFFRLSLFPIPDDTKES